MKKTVIALMGSVLLMSSCTTYSGTGAVVGAQFGTILGSAVGGIAGGWRGSDIGVITGMAGGAIVGAAIGSAADHAEAKKYEEYKARRNERQGYNVPATEANDYETGTAQVDDRIDFDAPGPQGTQRSQGTQQQRPSQTVPGPAAGQAQRKPFDLQSQMELRNLAIVEDMKDGVLRAGESCKVIFELMNRTSTTLYNVCPMVADITHNKHILISPDTPVESVAPGTGIRYTATVTADRKLKNGQIVIRVGVTVNNRELVSQAQEITLPTSRH